MIGILLTNLGTPAAPTPKAVRSYLREFLWDPRVVELPRPLWWLILNGVILPTRPRRSAKAYQAVWTEAGSPLLTISQDQAAALQQMLQAQHGDTIKVELAMRYGAPSIASGLTALQQQGLRKLIVLPLYPQYSASTTASTFDAVAKTLASWRVVPQQHFINGYHQHPQYIRALADSVRRHWQGQRAKKLVMSFHGIPQQFVAQGDPYYEQCQATAKALAHELQLGDAEWLLSFQSRLGKAQWLQPYTDATLKELARSGINQVDVICPGFAADCLETLEEIKIRNQKFFDEAGGEALHYIPALNTQAKHIECLANLVNEFI